MYNICNFASSSTGEPVLCINRPIESADLRIKNKQDMPEELQKALPDLDKMKDLYCKSL